MLLISMAGIAHSDQYSYADYLGPLADVPPGEDPYPVQEKINRFVWAHWKARTKTGYVQATFHSKEGETTLLTAVVGPNVSYMASQMISGERPWRLSVSLLREYGEPDTFTAFKIELKPRKSSKQREVLILKDKDGRVITEW